MNNSLLFRPDAIVIGNGELPSRAVLERWIDKDAFLVCCDGAANRFLSLGFRTDLIIGDGDSIDKDWLERNPGKFLRIEEQDYNDQTKAVLHLKKMGKQQIVILGATGKREDHTLGNISLLLYYQKLGITALIPTEHGLFVPCSGNVCLPTKRGQQISVFNYNAHGLCAENLRYPLRDFDMLWQGTLNEATADEVTVRSESGSYLIYLANEIR